jgi:HSP20 family protein
MSIEKRKDKKSIFDIMNEMFDQIHNTLDKEFQDMMEFGGFFPKPSWKINGDCCSLEPLVDIKPTENQITIIVDLPKVNNKDDIELNISKDTIQIIAKLNEEVCYEKWGGIQKRIKFCQFEKTIRIPWKINPEKVEAKFKNGILEVKAKRLSEFKKIDIKD